MSYAIAAACQTAVYEQLANDSGLSAIVSGAIYDAVPTGPIDGTIVVIGDEVAQDWSDQSGGGLSLRLTISVISDAPGYRTAKEAAGAVSDALIDAGLSLTRGRLISLKFLRARARRVRAGQTRRVDLFFRAIVEDDQTN
ncbi:MAG: DUF3168 domain-containing protein [Boseongicola sp.]|nr:DUF3168 domain-containing protein [Boseongicola sp.]MDD9976398.1 DUF3168 domain-containing protein [Boseongicola sp.]